GKKPSAPIYRPDPNYIKPTKLELLSQLKKEYTIKRDMFEEEIWHYTKYYD
ncbi:13997_t:CDS:1, partial [Funneliformis geosporum]